MDKLALGSRIRRIRQDLGLTQLEAAAQADISNTTLCDIEKGRISPSLETLAALASALQTSAASLLDEGAEKSPHPAQTQA